MAPGRGSELGAEPRARRQGHAQASLGAWRPLSVPAIRSDRQTDQPPPPRRQHPLTPGLPCGQCAASRPPGRSCRFPAGGRLGEGGPSPQAARPPGGSGRRQQQQERKGRGSHFGLCQALNCWRDMPFRTKAVKLGWDTRYKSNKRLSEASGGVAKPTTRSAGCPVSRCRGQAAAVAAAMAAAAAAPWALPSCPRLSQVGAPRRRGAHYGPGSPRSMLEPNIFTSCCS